MRKLGLLLAVFGATFLPQLYPAPAYALSYDRTFVSHTGNDNNSCLEASPCFSLGQALTVTVAGGEVHCLDTGDYNNIIVTFSVTIDCSGTNATIYTNSTGDGIDINAPGATVILRGITMNVLPGLNGVGINISSAAKVFVEDCVVTGYAKGIADMRATGLTQLFVNNTIVRGNNINTNSPGILLAAAPKNSVVLENVRVLANGYGIAVATGNNVVISRSVISGNGIAGIEADPGATVMVDNTEITHNASYGIFALGTVGLANSDISFNTSSISGATFSYGNNRLLGNGGGTAPTPAGGTSTDFGQQ